MDWKSFNEKRVGYYLEIFGNIEFEYDVNLHYYRS